MNFNFNYKDIPQAAEGSIHAARTRVICIAWGIQGLNGFAAIGATFEIKLATRRQWQSRPLPARQQSLADARAKLEHDECYTRRMLQPPHLKLRPPMPTQDWCRR